MKGNRRSSSTSAVAKHKSLSGPSVDGQQDLKTEESASYGTFQPPNAGNEDYHRQQSRGVSEEDDATNGPPRRTNIYVYCSHFLASWGYRMWSFGVGLFLVRIAGNSLQLPASYGLTSGLAIFLLGAVIGDWVDSTPRLKAAQLSLVLQNLLVAVCAAGVYAYIHWEKEVLAVPGGWTEPVCQAAVILLAVLSALASLARVITVERDWVVKICRSDSDMLAKMSATLRRIDQVTLILAPVATGQIMTYVGLENGALFIGAWNLCSLSVEYYLMWKVYVTVPELAIKDAIKNDVNESKPVQKTTEERRQSLALGGGTSMNTAHPGVPPPPPAPQSSIHINRQDTEDAKASLEEVKTTPQWNETSKNHSSHLVSTSVASYTEVGLQEDEEEALLGGPGHKTYCCHRLTRQFRALYEGWRTYSRYKVSLAGVALSFLFMTVLGFDNITVAYAVTQGVSESILGIAMAASAVFGMLGTFIYPIMRRRVGLVRTVIMALSAQLACLSLCVASVWMPGSPFDPTYSRAQTSNVSSTTTLSPAPQYTDWRTLKRAATDLPFTSSTDLKKLIPLSTDASTTSTASSRPTTSFSQTQTAAFVRRSTKVPSPTAASSITVSLATTRNLREDTTGAFNTFEYLSENSSVPADRVSTPQTGGSGDSESYMSVSILLTGIVLARFGLWTADLAITQQFMEDVAESERGVVNGVQNSLNKLMDVLKFVLVVFVPDTETFGFLILASFAFTCAGWILYAVYLRRIRGHLLPKCCICDAEYANDI